MRGVASNGLVVLFSCSKWQSPHQPVVIVEDLEGEGVEAVEGDVGVAGGVDEGSQRIRRLVITMILITPRAHA